jgi:predicted Zn-dependent protease
MRTTTQTGYWLCPVLLVLQLLCFGEAANPDSIAKATALFKAGKVKQAESVLRAASAANPDSAPLHGALGELLFNEHRYDDCIQELNLAVGLDPSSRKHTILLAEALIGTQRFGVALDFLTKARSRFDDYFQLHYDLGLAYYFMNKIDEAQAQFEEAHRLSPEFDGAEFLMVGCLMAKGESQKAVELLRKLVKERPRNAVYWSRLGRTLGPLGEENKAEALRACRRALALQPNDPHIQFDAATVFTEAGEFVAARPLLEHLEKSQPGISAVHVQLARVYTRLGEQELARREREILARLPKQEAPQNSPAPPSIPR